MAPRPRLVVDVDTGEGIIIDLEGAALILKADARGRADTMLLADLKLTRDIMMERLFKEICKCIYATNGYNNKLSARSMDLSLA